MITGNTVLFFDLDGTLINTNLANFLSYKKAIVSVRGTDYDLKFDPNRRFNRTFLNEAVPGLSDADYKKIVEEKENNYKEFLNETDLDQKKAAILSRYCKTNLTVLVSNCRKDRALQTLSHFGLTEHFRRIFCRETNAKGEKVNKFQNAISTLGIQPDDVIAFEDEETEIADAKKAGIKIINPDIY